MKLKKYKKYTYTMSSGIPPTGVEGCNTFLIDLRKYDLLDNKHIPRDFMINSRENRLELLA